MVFDSISWGEIFIVGAVGVAITGRKDLPKACYMVGEQMGRVVGLLQGARAKADQFAANNELRQLQNELRSGLRELDQAKSELAIAASTQGIVGRALGTTTGLANQNNRNLSGISPSSSPPAISTPSRSSSFPPASSLATGGPGPSAASSTVIASATTTIQPSSSSSSASSHQTMERAVMEEEWEKRGIGFRSIAEQGVWMGGGNNSTPASDGGAAGTNNGSELLANLIKENLIFDQYDRVVGEQESKMSERIEQAKQRSQQQKEEEDK